jgi:D-cysteine desulfhydrase
MGYDNRNLYPLYHYSSDLSGEMSMHPIFEQYPLLQSKLPYLHLCDLPTPILQLEQFGKTIHHPEIYIKRDDISAKLFGGNKVRALEFLLGSANNRDENIVIGLPGTSMALAANIYAHKLGIPIKTILIEQFPTIESQHNLRYFQFLGAELFAASLPTQSEGKGAVFDLSSLTSQFEQPNILNPNSSLGMCGFVNAAFELQIQVAEGWMPEPDLLYVPLGLFGTATGLMLGLKAAGLKTKVICCPVQQAKPEEIKMQIAELFEQANAFLNQLDESFPLLSIKDSEIEIRTPSLQSEEAHQEESLDWIVRFSELESVSLDATWTAPTVASLITDIGSENLKEKTILYWHTYNSRPYPYELDQIDYHQLPKAFWHYFETKQLAVINKPIMK